MLKMTSKVFVDKALDIANNYKTSYIWGGLGSPITEAHLQSALRQYNKNTKYVDKARRYVGQDKAFFFDCVGLIKCILWGWKGDSTQSRGGAVYGSNGVPDTTADGMIANCSGVSTDFSDVEVGEVLWRKGHIGIYVGDGLGVECTPAWKNGVQVTAVSNIGAKSGYNSRKWTKHGKLPYVDYGSTGTTASTAAAKPAASTGTAATKPEPAALFNRQYARPYTTTADLNLRLGASVKRPIIRTLAKGETVTCYGYYSINGSTVWLSVRDKKGNEGFCSKAYLR